MKPPSTPPPEDPPPAPRSFNLGKALRLGRELATSPTGQPMTIPNLVALVSRERGLFRRLADQALILTLTGIEAGAAWPFHLGEEQHFVADCAEVLCGGDEAKRSILQYELSTAASDDLMGPWL
jgi:hypothetical protein